MENRKFILGLFLLAFLGVLSASTLSAKTFSEDEPSTSSEWTMVGPNNISGRVRTAIFDRYNYGVVYAGTVAGLYVSVDNGNSWREISLGSGHENITSLVQDENGVLYVGTGEGYYNVGLHNENHLGYSDEPTGRIGSGVYKSNTIATNWAESLQGAEAKYDFICNALTFSVIEGTEVANKYDEYQPWAYINAMAYANNTVYVATKNAGLFAINTTNNVVTDLSLGFSNVYDVVASPNGKVATVYFDDVNAAEIAMISKDENNNYTTRVVLTQDTLGVNIMGRVKLAFGNNNADYLYAYVASKGYTFGGRYIHHNSYEVPSAATTSALSGFALGIWRTTNTDDGNIAWQCITPSSFSNGQQHNYAMSLAINDANNREIVYAGANRILEGQDVNGNGIFSFSTMTNPTMDMTDLETSSAYGMGYVPANIHSILFMANPQNAADSVFQLYTTDAGVYTYQYDSVLKNYLYTPGKGMNNLQTYKVTAAADGAIMAAAQSNAMVYIPTPSLSTLKTGQYVWAVNSTNYPSTSFFEETSNNYASSGTNTAISTSGTNVVSSAINKTLPSNLARKPYIVARPFINVARTYGNRGVYDEVETETVWNFGGATTADQTGLFMSQNVYAGNVYARFVTPMTYWETFNGATNLVDSIDITLREEMQLIRGNERIDLVRGTAVKNGDELIISDNNFLGYPFVLKFDESYRLEDVADEDPNVLFYYDTAVASTNVHKLKISPKVQTRFVLSTPQGVFLTAQPMDFTRRYDYINYNDILDTNKFLLWKRIYTRGDVTGGSDFPVKLFNESVRTVSMSADGGSVFLAVDIYNAGTGTADSISYENYLETQLVRVDGINNTSLYYVKDRYAGSVRDTSRFQSTVIGTYDRKISTIATDPNDVNKIVVAFEGYKNGDNLIYSTNAMSETPTFIALVNPPQSNSDRAPVYAALIEKFGGNDLYVGTEEGIYKMSNFTAGGQQWEKDGNIDVPVYHLWQQIQNLPQFSFTETSAGVTEDITYSATENAGIMYAATYGRGVLMNARHQQENPNAISYVGLSKINNPAFVSTLNVYPNPVSTQATISYSLNETSSVLFRMYDMNGRLISTLDNGRQAKGTHTQLLDVSNMTKGVYVIQMIAGDVTRVAKLIVE